MPIDDRLASPPVDLLARTAAGDRDAFQELMVRHERMVFAACLRILQDRDEALDAAQETFLTVYRRAGQFRGDSAPGTWIYRIAVNTCLDLLRRRRRGPLPVDDWVDEPDPAPWHDYEAAELRPDLVRALASLPADMRATVVLADAEGLPLPEVARLLGVPVGTVKSRVFRARRQLARLLGDGLLVGSAGAVA